MFPNFVFRRRGDAAVWLERNYDEPAFIACLSNADCLFAQAGCQIVKDQRKIKIGRLTLTISGRPRTLYVKRYNAFSLSYKLASPFRNSRAFRSLRGAAILRAAHIPSAAPVAAVENRKNGALTKSFFLTEEIGGGETSDVFWRVRLLDLKGSDGFALRRRFLAQLAGLFRTLHDRRIYHNDLKDVNIFAAGAAGTNDFRFVLLDLDGVARLKYLSQRRKIKNLVQLNRTLGRYLRRVEKLFFLKNYLGANFNDRKLRRHVLLRVISESERWDRLNRPHD
jgi:hypothetical protein